MFERRPAQAEIMDGPGFGPREVAATFRFLEPVNRIFGGVRPALRFFRRESQNWDRQRTYHVLDAGCGAGDVPIALVRWSRQAGYHLQIAAIDSSAPTIAWARRKCQHFPEITLACQDVLQIQGRTYDYVHAGQFIHHFPDRDLPGILKHLLELCRSKLVVNDLVRAPLAYLGTWLLTLVTSAVFRHDARLSVRKGFLPQELERLLQRHGLGNFCIERHFFYRFLLIVDKERTG